MIIRGINPKLIFPATGKSCLLPRFSSLEMLQARQMNKLAVKQIKKPVIQTFPKASIQDFKRLTSEKIEDTYSRAKWTNPKDGKIYNLLKTGEAEDGKIKIKILDKDGAFIKEACIKPKNIVIIDCSQAALPEDVFKPSSYEIPELSKLTHIQAIEIFARRNNPFANYQIIDASYYPLEKNIFGVMDEDIVLKELKRLEKENNIDYINCSFGQDIKKADKALANKEAKLIAKELDKLAQNGTRIIMCAGNGCNKALNIQSYSGILLNGKKIEGVGSLSTKGVISDFSGSRSSKYTQHYECGEVLLKSTSCGINITGIPGTDILFQNKNPLLGHTRARIKKFLKNTPNKNDLIKLHGRKNGRRLWKQLCKKYVKYLDNIKQLYFPPAINKNDDSVIASLNLDNIQITGTSISTPIRTAKLALNDMMEGII